MTALRNIGAIVEKEWRHYFGSPIAYVALSSGCCSSAASSASSCNGS